MLTEAAVASVVVVLVHGLVDNVVYRGRGILFLWVPLALLASLRGSAASVEASASTRAGRWRYGRLGLVATVMGLGAVLAAYWRPALSRVYANLGSVEQARVELTAYDPSAVHWRSLDEIRREENLDRAIGWFRRALVYDGRQVTARQRLAAVAMARGDYAEALRHMEAVCEGGHRDPTTRLLLGDALVANGDVSGAALVIAGQPRAVDRLLDQAWSRYWEAERWGEARDAWETVLLLEPENRHAAYWAGEATQRLVAE